MVESITIIPAVMTPSVMGSMLFLGLNPKNDATNAPVQAPVPGSGIATKMYSPNLPYLSIVLLFSYAFLLIQSTKGLKVSIVSNHCSTFCVNKIKNGIGKMLPITDKKNASAGLMLFASA